MKNPQFTQILTSSGVLILSTALLSVSQAATIDVSKTWQNVAPNVVSTLNLGGLDTNVNDLFLNGDDRLSFLLTIDDSGDTGSVYSAVLTLAGVTNDLGAQVSTNVAGRVVFASQATRQDTLTLTVGSITKVSGPDAIVTFDGFKSMDLDQWSVANDAFNFDGNSYDGVNDGGTTIIFDFLAPSGSTIDSTSDGQFRPGGLTSTFTVSPSAVPEPSSALMGLFSITCLFIRRRR